MRFIKLTDALKQSAIEKFTEELNNNRYSNSTINFSFNLNNNEKVTEEDKIILNITPEAWLKMWTLVHSESKEIGWHGIVNRVNDKIFLITDILMYPQITSSVTVETDDVEYGNWLHKELSDEQINTLRFHGHSHVNMGTTPSGVDTTWYNQILQGLEADDFYIFMILNKKEDYFIEIYDLATNTIYEKKDIKMNVIMQDNNYLNNWLSKQKEQYLKKETYTGNYSRLDAFTPKSTNVIEVISDLTLEDLDNEPLVKGLVEELTKLAMYTGYFGVGWQKWHMLSNPDKVIAAQEYYLYKDSPTLSAPKKKGRPRKKDYLYGGLYD